MIGSTWGRLVPIAAAGVIGIGGVIAISTGGPTTPPVVQQQSGTANLFVVTSGGTTSCVRQSSPTTFANANSTAKCSTFDAANDHCSGGDTVLVEAGSYAAQDLTGSNSRASTCTMKAESGQTVTVTSWTAEAGADWITLKDVADHTGDSTHASIDCSIMAICVFSNNVVLDNIDITGPYATINIDGCTGCTWKNSDFGTSGNTTSVTCAGDQPGAPMQMANDTNVVVQNIQFWQFEGNTAGCGTHLEDIRIWDTSDGINFVSNVFHGGGADSAYISSSFGGCPPPTCPQNKNIRFFNNAFLPRDPGLQSADILYGDNRSCDGFVFEYNIFTQGINNQCPTSETNSRFIGNIMNNATGGCVVTGTNTNNLFYGASSGCSSNTFVGGDVTTVKLAADGYHLTNTSPAINAGENTRCTADLSNLDIDGLARIGVCDAGPDEFGN